MILRANCKINIGLDVLRRREDGFHELSTVMYPVQGLYDTLTVVRSEEMTFKQTGICVDCPTEKNLCVKAARLMQRCYGVDNVAITLDKRVPFGAGLGGGSSDATAVILAMNELFDLSLSEQELTARAAELGSDTAFFVRNTPQLCTGRGEVMTPIALPLAGLWLVVIKPEVSVSTAEAYGGVKPFVPEVSLDVLLARPIEQWQGVVKNDFEAHIFKSHPLLGNLKQQLLDAGAIYASMSGSGSALFGIFDCRPEINFDSTIFTHIEQL
ncbi:MAG: 4-(cytidine 5'-diphospho)-2-C-methyl-D-erythritol kinase [Alistipes sp.]|nr:4-(cytidine 5'-diphospho)-2-C-methyl-D-erythritol kinase [Alistipes sp.]